VFSNVICVNVKQFLFVDITGGPCRNYTYVLEQFHLHWGDSDSTGSEHLVNSRPYAAEVSRMTWRTRLFVGHSQHAELVGHLTAGNVYA
jgi:Eukaryotic-type carbonic anhydrase